MNSKEYIEANHKALAKYLMMVRNGDAPIQSTKELAEVTKLIEDLKSIDESGYTCVPSLTCDDYC